MTLSRRDLIFTCFKTAIAGGILPLGFAPFHFTGCIFISIAYLFYQLTKNPCSPFLKGYAYGIGAMSIGISWVYVSIHAYGHLHPLIAGLITAIFILYLAIFPGFAAWTFQYLSHQQQWFLRSLLFSACWTLAEFIRANLMGGFPWLLIGFSQMDTPLKHLLPILGIYGVGFLACMISCFVIESLRMPFPKRSLPMLLLSAVLLGPLALNQHNYSQLNPQKHSVAIIQANLSMKEKWDEHLFWRLIDYYQTQIEKQLTKNNIIVMPESAIPLPRDYINDFIDTMHHKAQLNQTSILLGIPANVPHQDRYYNTVLALGQAKGRYKKQHLVPFGEYIPAFLSTIFQFLAIPDANMAAGPLNQHLIHVQDQPIATLICYEIAYPAILRRQLPKAKWIVSLSDDGWFGHSFAMYQQLQMAQVLSTLTERFQIVANNDGLSAVIDHKGHIQAALPAYTEGVLEQLFYDASGSTPWVKWGDEPWLILFLLVIVFNLIKSKKWAFLMPIDLSKRLRNLGYPK